MSETSQLAPPAIEITALHKSYGTREVLRGIDLTIGSGALFGLLGPNGAGKTTLLQTILGLLRPNSGSVAVLGQRDPERFSTQIGYLPERPRFPATFTAREYLTLLATSSGLSGVARSDRVDTTLETVSLHHAADQRMGTFSKGMAQRLGIAQAIVHEPSLLIVDEPSSGLDPGGQIDMAALLESYAAGGRTVVICTHHLTDVARCCTEIGVLAHGRIAARTTLADLALIGHSVRIDVNDLPMETAYELRELSPAIRCDRVSVTLFPTSDVLQAQVLATLLDAGVVIRALQPDVDVLEQFYVRAVHGSSTPAVPPPVHDPETKTSVALVEDQ